MSRLTLVLVSLCLAFPAFAGTRMEHLPTPAGLERDVRFWEKIFSKYTPDQCVFHDKENLDIIYVVKRIPGTTPQGQARNVKRYLGAIRASMLWLASGAAPRNLLERRIVDVTDPQDRQPDYYRNAADNVRCQRGVDLKPSLARSQRHVRMIKKVLAEHDLPTDLAYLPHLESGYDVLARSRAGARGLWQLMPATARLNGLRVGRTNDQRTNALKSTVAACGMLRDFYDRTGAWPLAITAYNYGVNGMSRAIRKYGADYMTIREKHRTGIFGFASKNYYPSFLAVRNIAARQEGEAIEEPVADPVAEM